MSLKIKIKMDSKEASPLVDKIANMKELHNALMSGNDGVKKGVDLASIAKKVAKRKLNKIKNNN